MLPSTKLTSLGTFKPIRLGNDISKKLCGVVHHGILHNQSMSENQYYGRGNSYEFQQSISVRMRGMETLVRKRKIRLYIILKNKFSTTEPPGSVYKLHNEIIALVFK